MAETVVFAFGADGSYFLQSPLMTRWKGLPKAINDALTDQRFQRVIHMALGPNGSYFVSYKQKNGSSTFYTSGLPANLQKWLDTKDKKGYSVFNIQKLRLSFGPNGSWYCHDGHNFWGSNLPSGLQAALANMKNPKGQFVTCPRIVALGPSGSYVMVNARHGGSWNVKALSEKLDQQLHSLDNFKLVHDVALNNFGDGHFILHMSNGSRSLMDWQVPQTMGDAARAFDAEVELAGERAVASANRRRSNIAGGLKLGAQLLGALSGGSVAGSSGGAYVDNNNTAFDMSSFWQPIQAAASAPIQ